MNIGLGIGIPFNRSQIWLSLFDPSKLFTAGVNGVWYDPSDITTLYRDAAGTLPVTAVEQPVGLMLDKSKGLVLGPELVINGGFDADTNWTKNGWVISDGVASSSVTAAITQTSPVTLAVGDLVKVTVTVSSLAAGYVYAWVAGSVDAARRTNSVGTFTWYFNITSVTNQEVGIYTANAPAGVTIDNVSIQRLPGNHAFNPSGNSANFPVLSARYNLLTKSEDFSDAVWTKQAGTTVSSTKVAAPDGTLTAFSVTGNGTSGIYQTITGTLSLGQSVRAVYLRVPTGTATVGIKDPVLTQGTTTCNLTTSWQRFTLTETTPSSGGFVAGIWIFNIPASGIEVAWPDTRSANDALNQPAYQRVNTATDYDTVGFKPYLRFNGVNQWLQTNSIDFSYSDKMFVCAGVRKLSDAALGILMETGIDVTSAGYPGSFAIFAPDAGAANYRPFFRGDVGRSFETLLTYSAPITNVLAIQMSNQLPAAGDAISSRINGVAVTATESSNITDAGNYGNYPLYIGARAGSSLWFNGRLYGMVVAGKQASAAEIQDAEKYMNLKTAVYN